MVLCSKALPNLLTDRSFGQNRTILFHLFQLASGTQLAEYQSELRMFRTQTVKEKQKHQNRYVLPLFPNLLQDSSMKRGPGNVVCCRLFGNHAAVMGVLVKLKSPASHT